MFRMTVQSLVARKGRFLLTAAAVVLGVAFMAGTLVMTATIDRAYGGVVATGFRSTDAVVQARGTVDGEAGRVRGTLDAAVVDAVRRVDGVAAADGMVGGSAWLVGRDGKLVDTAIDQATPMGMAWPSSASLNPLRLVAGRAPGADTEIVVDRASARDGRYRPGDAVRVITRAGSRLYTISGVATYGSADDAGGAGVVAFTAATARRVLGEPGRVDSVRAVAAPGLSQAELAARLRAALATSGRYPGVEVVTGRAAVEAARDLAHPGVPFLALFLPVFAVTALFVGAFVIYNAFSITTAQRTRETATLRAVGASRRQVRGAVALEAAILGVVASAAGAALGVALARGLTTLLEVFGVELPAGPLVVPPASLAVVTALGTVVTLLAAFVPARRASKVAPIAALRGAAVDRTVGSRRRALIGAFVGGLGVVALVAGGRGGSAGQVALGALGLFTGVVVLGPVVGPGFVRVLGGPVAMWRGVTGALARENAARDPRRTAATASALTIGVALVVLVSVFAASARSSMDANIDRALRSDWVITALQTPDGLGPSVARAVDRLPETESVTAFRFVPARSGGAAVEVTGIDPADVGRHLDTGVQAGSMGALSAHGIGVSRKVAAERNLRIGDAVSVTFAETGTQHFRVAVVYDLDNPLGDYLVSDEAFDANVSHANDQAVFVTDAPGVSDPEARAAIERALASTPTARLSTPAEFKALIGGRIDTLLNLVYVLLVLAVVIALFGIANTLALSVVERRREIGLLRAVGMQRTQLRGTIRWEAVLVALLGTAAGTALGLGFAWGLVEALAGEGIDRLAVPVARLVVIGVVGVVGAVLAAALPARRAARLDVLTSISSG